MLELQEYATLNAQALCKQHKHSSNPATGPALQPFPSDPSAETHSPDTTPSTHLFLSRTWHRLERAQGVGPCVHNRKRITADDSNAQNNYPPTKETWPLSEQQTFGGSLFFCAGLNPMSLCTLDKCFATESHPQSHLLFQSGPVHMLLKQGLPWHTPKRFLRQLYV